MDQIAEYCYNVIYEKYHTGYRKHYFFSPMLSIVNHRKPKIIGISHNYRMVLILGAVKLIKEVNNGIPTVYLKLSSGFYLRFV